MFVKDILCMHISLRRSSKKYVKTTGIYCTYIKQFIGYILYTYQAVHRAYTVHIFTLHLNRSSYTCSSSINSNSREPSHSWVYLH